MHNIYLYYYNGELLNIVRIPVNCSQVTIYHIVKCVNVYTPTRPDIIWCNQRVLPVWVEVQRSVTSLWANCGCKHAALNYPSPLFCSCYFESPCSFQVFFSLRNLELTVYRNPPPTPSCTKKQHIQFTNKIFYKIKNFALWRQFAGSYLTNCSKSLCGCSINVGWRKEEAKSAKQQLDAVLSALLKVGSLTVCSLQALLQEISAMSTRPFFHRDTGRHRQTKHSLRNILNGTLRRRSWARHLK